MVSQFQDITGVKERPNARQAAEIVMRKNRWDLNRAINWFHEHRHDDDLQKLLKEALWPEDTSNKDTPGKLT